MSSSNLIRLGGLSAVAGAVLCVIADLLHLTFDSEILSEQATTGAFNAHSVLFLLGEVLVLLGLVGLYASQSEAAGFLGLAAFLVALLGTALEVGALWADTFVVPSLAAEAPEVLDADPTGARALGFPLTFGLFGLGWILFGAATLRARIYTRAAAVLLIVGVVVSSLPITTSGVVLYAAVAWLGFELLTGGKGATRRPGPTSIPDGARPTARRTEGTSGRAEPRDER